MPVVLGGWTSSFPLALILLCLSEVVTATTSDDFPEACDDTNGQARSRFGGTCEIQEQFRSGCSDTFFDDNDFTAADMCCFCGGGEEAPEATCQGRVNLSQWVESEDCDRLVGVVNTSPRGRRLVVNTSQCGFQVAPRYYVFDDYLRLYRCFDRDIRPTPTDFEMLCCLNPVNVANAQSPGGEGLVFPLDVDDDGVVAWSAVPTTTTQTSASTVTTGTESSTTASTAATSAVATSTAI